jgi:hypothetical protein
MLPAEDGGEGMAAHTEQESFSRSELPVVRRVPWRKPAGWRLAILPCQLVWFGKEKGNT